MFCLIYQFFLRDLRMERKRVRGLPPKKDEKKKTIAVFTR